jgi:hypothetical protein
MPRKKSAPGKATEKTPPPEPKRRGRRKKAAEPAEHAAPAEPDLVANDGPVGPVETEVAAPEALTPAEPEPLPATAATTDEAALVAKYGATHRIVPGSLRYTGGREGWGHKRTVEVRCCACPAVRVLATSDLQWPTTKFCVACADAAKRNRRAKKWMK